MILRPGDEPIPGYRLESFLGKGQFGQVWKAHSPGKTYVALKFLDLAGKQGRKEFRAIQRVKAIRHAHLMPITALWLLDDAGNVLTDDALDEIGEETERYRDTERHRETLVAPVMNVGKQNPSLLVVAQLLADKTLGDRLEECEKEGLEGIPIRELITYMEESAKGIDYLNSAKHDLGVGMFAVQHCDIKPANILLIGESVLICDYGVAQVLSESSDANRTTGMVGSPAYISPECIDQKTSAASDQYSLAVTYVELRTGELPFDASSFSEVLDCHRRGRLKLSMLPPAEQDVIRKATAIDPEHRYPSATKMVQELRAAALGEPREKDRTKSVAILVAALTVCVACVVGMMMFGGNDEPTPVAQRSLRFEVQPVSAGLTVNGEMLPLDASGVAQWKCDADEVLQLEAAAGPNFLPWRSEIALVVYHDDLIKVTLEHDAEYYASESQRLLDSGKMDEAAEQWAKAIAYDSTNQYAYVPEPAFRHLFEESRLTLAGTSESWLGTIAASGAMRFWDLARLDVAARDVFAADAPKLSPWQVKFSQRWAVVTFVGGRIQVVDLQASPPARKFTWNVYGQPQLLETIEVAISTDDKWLLTASSSPDERDSAGESIVQRWDLTSSNPADTKNLVAKHADAISAMAVLPQGDQLVTVSWDTTARQWPILDVERSAEIQVEDGELLARHSDRINCLAVGETVTAFAGEGSRVNGTSGRPGEHGVSIYREKKCTSLPKGHSAPIESLVIDSQENWIASASESVGTDIQVWNLRDTTASPAVLRSKSNGYVQTMCFDPSGEWLISGGNDGQVLLWDFQNSTRPGPVMLKSTPAEIVFVTTTEDGRWLIACAADGVWIWDLRKLQVVKRACDKAHLAPKPIISSEPVVGA